MNAQPLLDDASAEVLGFEWLAQATRPVSPYGERAFWELRPFEPGAEALAQARAERITEISNALNPQRIEAIRAALTDLPDVAGAIARTSLGEVLGDPAFLELRRFCAILERIDAFRASLAALPQLSNGAVRAVRDALAIGQTREDEFYLADGFSAALTTARTQLTKAQAELDALRGRETERVARELGRQELGGEEFIVMRADLHGGRLPAGVRVVREAATYFLCALQYNETTLAALERRDIAADVVGEAEEQVRTELSSIVRQNIDGLSASAGRVAELDVLVAAARFAQRFACVSPVVTKEAVLAFEQARFLPLEFELTTAGRTFTPLDVQLDAVAVLTGPNMGGKSVCLQTCGFLALCTAFGLPVPAARGRVGLFTQIAWLGMGRGEQIGGLLSSFAREVLALKEILSGNAARLLILIDEFARTTTPHEGKALLVALLERLRERRACGMLATHLGGVAAAAGARHFAVRGLRGIPAPPITDDIGEALAALGASMDYRIAEVKGDELSRADAIALTGLLGIDRQFVDAAYRALAQ